MKDKITIEKQLDVFKQEYQEEKKNARGVARMFPEGYSGAQAGLSEIRGKIIALKWVLK